jgi:SIR2-like domain
MLAVTLSDEIDSASSGLNYAALPFPTAGVDNRTTLAMGLQAAPGAYAVLAGSGISRAANIPTAWEVAQDLVRRIAVAEGVDLSDRYDTPELWWEERGRSEPRYDTLVAALAPTEAARQRLLASYFDPATPAGTPTEPSVAHQALATLVASGRVRVILTTNLDRLTERALDRAGVVPQVIMAPEQVKAMTPLMHARATVVKLHGDYTMLGSRNTADELANYPPEWQKLLARIFEEFGLIVIGWSAQYDKALAQALSTATAHPYPVFWTAFNGILTEEAKHLIGQRRAAIVNIGGADEFLVDVNQRIARLDHIAARKGKPQRLAVYHQYMQHSGSPPPGWAALPLLYLRVVAVVAPVFLGESQGFGPEQRDALCASLRDAQATIRLRELTGATPAYATQHDETPPAISLGEWHATPSPYQSSGNLSYRLGGDATSGISALATTELPTISGGGVVTLTIDTALSLAQSLYLFQVCFLLRDCLVLTTGAMFDAVADVLPIAAEVTQVQLYIATPTQDGTGNQRQNDLLDRIKLTSLGAPTRPIANILSYAVQIAGPLVHHDAAEIVVEAIRASALDNGYLDPRLGITELRGQMGLSQSPQ